MISTFSVFFLEMFSILKWFILIMERKTSVESQSNTPASGSLEPVPLSVISVTIGLASSILNGGVV